ncbi:hypothetical protein [Paenibacillus alkalitolerans]|uniref:hypothetical protein n=1 Tax=Paenibacillus alkalitolerans TaxID=2799335 RepID=UPI0018F42CA3|nr:hypothetical protein [Paenibacillus alkalitolerans]
MIQKYLDTVNVEGKSFVFCVIAPKGKYPLKSFGKEFDNYASQVFGGKEKYISLFEQGRPEILQDVAFKIYTLPLIGDSYSVGQRETIEEKRATKDQMEAFIVVKEFYNTVPYGELIEEEAIKQGLEKAKDFIKRYPKEKYDVVIKKVRRHDDGAQILIDMEFDRDNKEYVFDFCYCH